jgi:hypothetical protein
VFDRLNESKFRSRFRLGDKERAYIAEKGMEAVAVHAREMVSRRLAPAVPLNDGKQTPMRGHPVFIAQHATATCCRSCLAKWHGIPAGQAMGEGEQAHAVEAILRWIAAQPLEGATARQGRLF